jgi:Na+/H+ antiporter NhaC
MKYDRSHGLLLLTPFITFVALFVISALFFNAQLSPLCTCLVAIALGLMTLPQHLPFNKRMEIALDGSSQPTIIAMCYIFIFSAVFTHVLTLIGGLQAATNIGTYLIAPQYILPGFFSIVSLFATVVGTSMGAIAAFLPIGMGIAQQLGIDSALMAGVTVGAAMLGDNLSLISDTTIAAVQTVECSMQAKFKENLKLVIPACLLTIITLTIINGQLCNLQQLSSSQTPNLRELISVSPYCIIICCALMGIDVIAVLLIGITCAIGIGIWQDYFSFIRGTGMFLEGFAQNAGGIQEVLILVLLVAALSHIVEYNGGIKYILNTLSKRINSPASAEWHIALLVFIVNAAVAINTIAILITGPVAKKIGDHIGISRARIAALIDIVACICQGILPYAPQLLLASSLSGVTTLAIMPHLHYQWFMLLVTGGSIIRTYYKNASVK